MDEFERRLQKSLHDRSAEIESSSVDARQIKRRSHTRRAFAGSAAALSVALIALTAFQSVSGSRDLDTEPAVPASSPSSPPDYAGSPERIDKAGHPPIDCSGFARHCLPFASGERNGLAWTLFLFKETSRMGGGLFAGKTWCVGLDIDQVGGGGCPASIPRGVHVAPGRSGGDFESEDVLGGRLSLEVARVQIHIEGYAPFDVPIIEGPRLRGPKAPGVNHFIAFAPTGSYVEVAVFDESGQQLQRRSIPNGAPMLPEHTPPDAPPATDD